MLACGNIPGFHGTLPGCNQSLSPVKTFFRNPNLMCALELYSIPGHDSAVKRILQDPVNGSPFKRITSFGLISQIITFPCNGSFIHVLVIIQIHDIRYHSIFSFVDLIGLPVSYSLIAETGRGLVAILESFFFHASQNFSRETDRVIFIHPLNDALDQASKGTVNKWLGYAYDIYVILFEHALVDNGFLLIAGKSGIFPDQYHIDWM